MATKKDADTAILADTVNEDSGKKNSQKMEPTLEDVDALIAARGLRAWQGAALCRAEGWALGKMVTQADFDAALERLNTRRMGG